MRRFDIEELHLATWGLVNSPGTNKGSLGGCAAAAGTSPGSGWFRTARGGLGLISGSRFYFAIVVMFAVAVPIAAHAGEAIRMPYSCVMDGVTPKLQRASPTRYEIIGQRRTRTYTACREKGQRDCRTMMVHSFKIRCGKVSVPWAEVAARVRGNNIGDSWMEDGRLNLLIANPNAQPSKKAAATKKTGSKKNSMAMFVMPLGFAPVVELGGRFEKGSEIALGLESAARAEAAAREGWETTSRMVVEPAVLSGAGGRQVGGADGDVIRAVLEDAQSASSWQTVVHPANSATAPGGSSWAAGGLVSGPMMAIVVMVVTSLFAALGWFGMRRYGWTGGAGAAAGSGFAAALAGGEGRNIIGRLGEIVGRGLSMLSALLVAGVSKLRALWVAFKWRRFQAGSVADWRNASIANGARSAESLYEKAAIAVRSLGPASALRDTLTSELNSVRHRLDALREGNNEEVRTARVAAGLRGAVRDLERIGRIADSAAASFKRGRDELAMPRTRSQAYEVLGANPDVSEAALKKIVDALRMGWHPDHSKDEADKVLREERTKQINIAWDLIVGKRAS